MKQKTLQHCAEPALLDWNQPLCTDSVLLQHPNTFWFIISSSALHRCTKPREVWLETRLQKQLVSLHRLPDGAVLRKLASWVQCFERAPSQLCSSCNLGAKELWVALPGSAQVWWGVLPSAQCQAMNNPQWPLAKSSRHLPLSYPARVSPCTEYLTPSGIAVNRKLTTYTK